MVLSRFGYLDNLPVGGSVRYSVIHHKLHHREYQCYHGIRKYWVNGPTSADAAMGLKGQPQHTSIRATLEARSQRFIISPCIQLTAEIHLVLSSLSNLHTS